jgi:hypothetical protein
MAGTKRPGIKFLFTGAEDLAHYAEGLGEFISAPVSVRAIENAVGRLLAPASNFGDAFFASGRPRGHVSAGRR